MDGAGKSTQMAWLLDELRRRGLRVVATREPGGTHLGERLREILLHEPMHLETETLLMFAARCEHLAELIRPALERGEWVVSDRFTDATFAYQGGGRGLAAERIAALERWVHPDVQPDLTLVFDIPPEVARQRMSSAGASPDRFEREQEAFFVRVRSQYLERARQYPGRIRVIDASGPPADVSKEVEQILSLICSI
jgi:dTMP kinase